MTSGEVLFAILTGLAINECCEISPWAARKLVRWSAQRRYTDPARARIRAEELAALIDDRPGKLFKLITALGFVTGAIMSTVRRVIARHLPRVMQLAQKLVPSVRAPLTPRLTGARVVLLDTSSHGTRASATRQNNGFVNDLECEWVLAACRRINAELRRRRRFYPPGCSPTAAALIARSEAPLATVSVLAYYGAQAHALRRLLAAHHADFPAIRFQVVGTLDEAQGQESDFAIVSFCRTAPTRSTRPWPAVLGFLSSPERFHIASTRARRGLILVGHAQTLRQVPGPAAELITQMLDGATVFGDLQELES